VLGRVNPWLGFSVLVRVNPWLVFSVLVRVNPWLVFHVNPWSFCVFLRGHD